MPRSRRAVGRPSETSGSTSRCCWSGRRPPPARRSTTRASCRRRRSRRRRSSCWPPLAATPGTFTRLPRPPRGDFAPSNSPCSRHAIVEPWGGAAAETRTAQGASRAAARGVTGAVPGAPEVRAANEGHRGHDGGPRSVWRSAVLSEPHRSERFRTVSPTGLNRSKRSSPQSG